MEDTDIAGFFDALSAPFSSVAMADLDRLVQSSVGARVFTIMAYDPAAGLSERIWTNAPDVYPVGGRKPLPQNRWTDLVIRDRQPFVANTPDAVAELLFDHDTIAALGCGSCLNLPIVVGGQVLGTLNLLDVPDHFTAERLAAADRLRLPAAAILLRLRCFPDHQP